MNFLSLDEFELKNFYWWPLFIFWYPSRQLAEIFTHLCEFNRKENTSGDNQKNDSRNKSARLLKYCPVVNLGTASRGKLLLRRSYGIWEFFGIFWDFYGFLGIIRDLFGFLENWDLYGFFPKSCTGFSESNRHFFHNPCWNIGNGSLTELHHHMCYHFGHHHYHFSMMSNTLIWFDHWDMVSIILIKPN